LAIITALTWLSWYRDGVLAQGYCPSSPYSDLPHNVSALPGSINSPTNQIFDQLNYGPRPNCLDCPPHAICQGGQMKCEEDYIRRDGAWGLGFGNQGLGILPVPECCEPDPERSVREVRLAMRIIRELKARRGAAECSTSAPVKESCFNLGLPEESFKEQLWNQHDHKTTREAWERIYEQAVDVHLKPFNEVGHCIDSDGHQWIMASTGDLSLGCRLKKAGYQFADNHKGKGVSLLGTIGLILYLRSLLSQKRSENEIVRELVGESLRLLQIEHQFAPAHLRDLVLVDEHSSARRRRLWSKVEPIVEDNSNVRTRQAEQRGETLRVWEWVGVNTPQQLPAGRRSSRFSLIPPPSA